MIDTHCHLDIEAFDADRAAVLERARLAGVTGLLVPAIRPRTWAALTALPAAHPDAPLALALGIHPQAVAELDGDERALIDRLADAIAAARTDRVVAIGECGLDGDAGERILQGTVFTAHLEAARALGLPLVIHVIRAHEIVPVLLKQARAHEVGGVIHSFSGSAELVKVYADLGFACAFAGPVTWPRARKPKWAAAAVPAHLLLAETDCPDQSPEGWRGRRNEPAALPEVIAGLAAARGATVAEVAGLTTANARRVFPAAARFW